MDTQDKTQILEQARAMLEAGQNDQARLLLLALLQQEPDNQAALLILGGAYYCSDRLADAEMIFERLVLLQPGLGAVSIALFNTLWKLGRQQEALEEIKRFFSVADRDTESETISQYIAITQQLSGS
ncbi:MAG: hypothetical protein OEW58_05705 [Gammaproteobacteria bacterium]|nr:hypothetical protein [Gammaproteobacteria bacterium]